MKRVLVTLATAALVIAGGCGVKSYDARLESTLEDMRYQKRLNDNLMPPVSKNKFEQLLIYIRPPKKLEQAKEFQLTDVQPGRFDLEASFLEPQKETLHVLARVKKSKAAAKNKKEAPIPIAGRGDFTKDVLALVTSVYPTLDLPATKLKTEDQKKNNYKFYRVQTEEKNIWVYFYKKDPYDVALVFEFPVAEKGVIPKNILCLESFAVGEKARRLFAGQGTEEEAASGGASGGGTSF